MSTVFLCHSGGKDISNSVAKSTLLIMYDVDKLTIEEVQAEIEKKTPVKAVRNFGMCIQNVEGQLVLSRQGRITVEKRSLRPENSPIRKFFRWLLVERLADGSFLDFFLHQPIESSADLITIMQGITKRKISVRFISRFTSNDLPPHNKKHDRHKCRFAPKQESVRNEDAQTFERRIVDVYLKPSKMRNRKDETMIENGRITSAIGNYERIRVVGKGAFGSAILYRRRDDDTLVVIKEINMHDLTATERQLAMNEVNLLSRLDHPSIISYFDSFEEDGILMIEMEYADGGTLAQHLSRCTSFLPEDQINYLMEQMLSAVTYLHENNVLHRDLKTANIFLMKSGEVKIGDFGISKLMGTETIAQGAKTVVGTPYYISPEMCEGKPYNDKSDIWALGCILYEMVNLQKAFDGENLPALVNKIMKCSYEPIRGPYSNDIKVLIRDMLLFDANSRPTARKAHDILTRDKTLRVSKPVLHSSVTCRSSVYSFDISTISLEQIENLPKIHVKQIAISETHNILVTSHDDVFSWGVNNCGQLGHGDKDDRDEPAIIESLSGRNVKWVANGRGFSLFCAGRGTVFFCGNRKLNGNGKRTEDVWKPTLIDGLLSSNILDIAVGDDHCVAIAEGGFVWVWGNGADGRLGTSNCNWVHTPIQISLPSSAHPVIGVRCGPDATALITVDGLLIAMGSNKHNKLSLAQRQGFFAREPSGSNECILVPTLLKPFCGRVVDAHLGRYHSGVILESGHVHLFGRNSCAELGLGHVQVALQACHSPVKYLMSKTCLQLVCGDGFSMVSTADNELYFWGSKGLLKQCVPKTTEDLESTRTSTTTTSSCNDALAQSNRWGYRRVKSADRDSGPIEQIVPHPSLVLRLDSAESYSHPAAPTIRISSLVCSRKKVVVLIDTTIPAAPKQNSNGQSSSKPRSSSLSKIEMDTKMNTWLKREMDDATFIPLSASMRAKKKTRETSASTDTKKASDKKLLEEIEKLKKDLMEQSSNFQGHQHQMALLQSKIAQLQSRQSPVVPAPEPPPAYDRKLVPYNKLFPENQQSKTCTIL